MKRSNHTQSGTTIVSCRPIQRLRWPLPDDGRFEMHGALAIGRAFCVLATRPTAKQQSQSVRHEKPLFSPTTPS